jgi:hypothetical protein
MSRAADTSTGPLGHPNARRLVAGQRYFGIEAQALRAGAERVLERIASESSPPPVDEAMLAQDFRMQPAKAEAVVRAMVTAGLLRADGAGGYRPTARFGEYAQATVVKPLSRARARALVSRASAVVADINGRAKANSLLIEAMAVSGSFMSRVDPLPELSLWLILRSREQQQARTWRPSLANDHVVSQMVSAVTALSSFIVVRAVSDRRAVQRPFAIVFEWNEEAADSTSPALARIRQWRASIGRRLGK